MYTVRIFDHVHRITNKHIERSVTLARLLSRSNVNDDLVLKLPSHFEHHITPDLIEFIFDAIGGNLSSHTKIIPKPTKDDNAYLNRFLNQQFIVMYVGSYNVIISIFRILRCNGIVEKFKAIFTANIKILVNDKQSQYHNQILQVFASNPDLMNYFQIELDYDMFKNILGMDIIKHCGTSITFYKILDRVNSTKEWITIPFTGKHYHPIDDTNLVLDMPTLIKRFSKYSYGVLDDMFVSFMKRTGNVYIAGGFLIGCMRDSVKGWSDIDIWVHGQTDAEILDKTCVVLHRLCFALIITGYQDILWSTKQNVITLYCANYKRNIQIIMVSQGPRSSVDKFDVDVVKAFTDGQTLQCTIGCLKSNRTNIIDDISLSCTPHRIVKMMLKGYTVTPQRIEAFIKTINVKDLDTLNRFSKIHRLVKTFHTYYLNLNLLENFHDDNRLELDAIINVVTNKYYYPSTDEVLEFINGTRLGRLSARAPYIIKQICSHTIVENDLKILIDKIKKGYDNSFLIVQYDNDLLTDVIPGLTHNSKLSGLTVINIDVFDPNKVRLDVVPIDEDIVRDTNRHSFSVTPVYMINELSSGPVFIRTDFIKLEWQPMTKFNIQYHQNPIQKHLYNIKVWDKNNNAPSLFNTMRQFDLHLSSTGNTVNLINIDKESGDQSTMILKNCIYHPLIKTRVHDADEDDGELIRRPGIPERYVVFKHYLTETIDGDHDKWKINTPVYKNGELIRIITPTDLAEHVKVGAEVQFEFVVDMMILKGVPTNRLPRLRLTRLFIR